MSELTIIERLTMQGLSTGMSYAEIARTVGKSPITVRGAAVRAKKHLGARTVIHAVVLFATGKKGNEQ